MAQAGKQATPANPAGRGGEMNDIKHPIFPIILNQARMAILINEEDISNLMLYFARWDSLGCLVDSTTWMKEKETRDKCKTIVEAFSKFRQACKAIEEIERQKSTSSDSRINWNNDNDA